MERDALTVALEEEEPLCEVLPASLHSPKASPVGLLAYYPWWPEQDEVNSKDAQQDDDGDIRTGAGLRNLGNTCFLNAVVQCLTYTPPLVSHLKNTHHSTPCEHEGFCAFCAMREHVNTVLSSSGRIVEPSHLVDNLSNLSSSFEKYQQEDAHEYMHCLLEALHKSTLSPKAAQACLLLQGDSFVKELFGGRLRSQIKCVECSHCSDSFEPLIDLSLEINNSDSLIEALDSFTAVETIECDDKYQCEKCKLGKSVYKQLTIDRAPKVLSIQLKRFTNTGTVGTKILKDVSFPQILDLKPYVNNGQDLQGDLKYELYGVLVHSGWTMNFGHYYSFAQTSPDVWHKLDDSQVRVVDIGTVLQQQAYILFYFRQGAEWFQGSATKISKHLSVESPKSVLDDSNANDDSDSLTDKESPRTMSDIQKGHDSLGTIYDRQNSLKEENSMVTPGFIFKATESLKQENMCEANELLSGAMDLPGKPINVVVSGEKEAAKIPLVPISSPSAEGTSIANCSCLSGKEKTTTDPVLGFQEMQQDEQTPKHLRNMVAEGSEDMPKYSKKTKVMGDEGLPKSSTKIKPQGDVEVPKHSRKFSIDNVISSDMKCSQGTPNSIKKVLNNMPGDRRACLLQFVQSNNNSFQTAKKENTTPHSRKKRNSPLKDSVRGKRQKHNVVQDKSSPRARSSNAAGSSVNFSQDSQEKHENLITLENDPYIFGDEIEQINQYLCRTSEVRSNSKLDTSSLCTPTKYKKPIHQKVNMQRPKPLKG
ncbi:ubiquitin carboxyl-terminal hydrolase 20 isoform X2 [Cryptomeria japonica]|uniref:ubiquitin carboxyl-terminal hydrolase 20 isoform X2 n=1 Tax=Cryptomeria japonica TaxID=3369 RepID=UPI0027DA72A8|nr:ubiquitin carboxyl-terminal hydrolase 20 isoform X2 [Cryptomeria japonica]